ncbi:MAG: NAD-dependent epimerase/dehydratase family protein [bacterium]
MKINLLLTGARGSLGQNLAEYFSSHSNYQLFTPSHTELDLTDVASLGQYLTRNSITHVVHAANLGGPRGQEDLAGVVTTNLRMFYNLVLHEDKLKKLVYFCSGAAFDKSKPIVGVQEEEVVNYLPRDDYGLSKNILARYLLARRDTKIIALRLFGIYGPHEDYHLRFISHAIVQNLRGLPITINQNVVFDYLPVHDLFPVVDYMLSHQVDHNIYQVTSGEKIDLVTLANLVNELSERPVPISVTKPGLAKEYTGSNARLKGEMGQEFHVTPHKEAVQALFTWLKHNPSWSNTQP